MFRIYFRTLYITGKVFGIGSAFFQQLICEPVIWIFTVFTMWLDGVVLPTYKKVQIRKPIFIIGHPRSGTTFLHELLLAATNGAGFKAWHVLVPALTGRALLKPLIQYLIRNGKDIILPKSTGHKVTLGEIEEEEMLFLHNYDTQFMTVELMGGDIQIESTPGQGSRIWFELNLPVVATGAATSTRSQRLPIGFKGNQKTVLVVDDKAQNRVVLVNLLAPLGFEVIEAKNGQAALQAARDRNPDLILMDLVMPVLDGFEAVRQLRKDPALQAVVIIGLSASVFEQNRIESLAAGCNDFEAKPVQVDALLEKIQTHLDLDWIYEEAPEAMPPAHRSMVVPSVESLRALSDLIRRGRIVQVRERLDQIEQMGAQYAPFANQLRQMAVKFRLKEMDEFIKPYILKS